MRFTADQLAAARTLPRICTVGVLAGVTEVPVSVWTRLRDTVDGPSYETSVNGVTVYRRSDVLHYMHRNIEDPMEVKE